MSLIKDRDRRVLRKYEALRYRWLQVEYAKTLYRMGCTYDHIGHMMGLSLSTISLLVNDKTTMHPKLCYTHVATQRGKQTRALEICPQKSATAKAANSRKPKKPVSQTSVPHTADAHIAPSVG